MSIVITIDIVCNICNTWDPENTVTGPDKLITEARNKAKKNGWVYKKIENELQDICPTCQKKLEINSCEKLLNFMAIE